LKKTRIFNLAKWKKLILFKILRIPKSKIINNPQLMFLKIMKVTILYQ